MKEFNNVDEILDFAMNSEQEAVDFYNELAASAKTEDMRNVFNQFAQEEIGHKAKIRKIKEEGSYSLSKEKVKDLKISDYTVTVEPTPNMSYQDALVLAMKKEKAAFRLYLDLSEKTENQTMKELFQSLAQEESKHKLRFELEYDEHVLKDN